MQVNDGVIAGASSVHGEMEPRLLGRRRAIEMTAVDIDDTQLFERQFPE